MTNERFLNSMILCSNHGLFRNSEHEVVEEIFDNEVAEEINDDEVAEEIIDDEVTEEFIDGDVAEDIIEDKVMEEIIDDELAATGIYCSKMRATWGVEEIHQCGRN